MPSSEISLESLGLVEELGGATKRELTENEMERLCNGVMAFCEELSGVNLYPYQREFAWRILWSLMIEDTDEITGLMSRQSGKSESVAVVVVGAMVLLPILGKIFTGDPRLNKFKDGLWCGIYAPKYELAGIMWNRMKLRLYSENAKRLLLDPSINIDLSTEKNDLTLSNGSFVDCGTANPQSKIEGKTYHLILLEESQDISASQIRGSIHPMGAAVGGSIVKIGTPNRLRGEFAEACRRNKRNDVNRNMLGSKKRLHFEYDYTVAQRYNPRYRKYIEKERERLGEDSEDFRLKYKLHWLSDKGVFISSDLLDECGIRNVKEGRLIARDKRTRKKDRQLIDFPRKPWFVTNDAETEGQVAGIDLGKEINSTVVAVGKAWWDYPVQYGEEYRYYIHLQNLLEIVGDDHEAQYPMIYDFLKRYNVGSIMIDATGKGDPIYTRMKYDLEGFGINVSPFIFSEKSKDVGYKVFHQELSNRRFTYPAGPRAVGKKEYTRLYSQMVDLEKFWRGSKMVVHKPKDKEARDDICDALMMMCYLVNVNESMEVEMDINPMVGRMARWMTADMIKKSGAWYRSQVGPKNLGFSGRGRESKRGKWE